MEPALSTVPPAEFAGDVDALQRAAHENLAAAIQRAAHHVALDRDGARVSATAICPASTVPLPPVMTSNLSRLFPMEIWPAEATEPPSNLPMVMLVAE